MGVYDFSGIDEPGKRTFGASFVSEVAGACIGKSARRPVSETPPGDVGSSRREERPSMPPGARRMQPSMCRNEAIEDEIERKRVCSSVD